MIQVKVAEGGYYENTLIIKDIEFEVLPGKLIRLIGSNGLWQKYNDSSNHGHSNA